MKRSFLHRLLIAAVTVSACNTGGEDPAEIGLSTQAEELPLCSDGALPYDAQKCRGPWKYYTVECSDWLVECVRDGARKPEEGLARDASNNYVMEVKATLIVEDVEAFSFVPASSMVCPDPSHHPEQCDSFDTIPHSLGGTNNYHQDVSAKRAEVWEQTIGKLPLKYAEERKNAPITDQRVEFTASEIAAAAREGFAPRVQTNGTLDKATLFRRTVTEKLIKWGYPIHEITEHYRKKALISAPVFANSCRNPNPVGTNYATCDVKPAKYTRSPADREGITLTQADNDDPAFRSMDEIRHFQSKGVAALAPVCTTHDEMPFATPAAAQAKFNAVSQEFDQLATLTSTAADQEAKLAPVVRELETVFLLKEAGLDRASTARLTEALTFAPTRPAWCGAKYEAVKKLFRKPLGETLPIKRTAEAKHRAKIVNSILNLTLSNIPAERVAELTNRLGVLGAWQSTATTEIPKAQREADEGDFTSNFWAGVYTPEFARLKQADLTNGTPEVKSAARLEALDEIFGNDFSGDREVLLALFPAPASPSDAGATLPLEGTLGARFVGSAFRGVSDRLRSHGYASDLACALLGDCALDTTAARSVRNMWAALAGLPVSTDLTRELNRFPADDEWRAVFEAIAKRHGAFLRLATVGVTAGGFPSARDQAPEATRDLVNVVLDGRDRLNAFTKTGALELLDRNVISRSQADLNVRSPALVSVLTSAVSLLDNEQTTLKVDRDQLVTGLIGELTDKTHQEATKQEFSHKLEQINSLASRIEALRSGIGEDQKKYSDFLKTFDAALGDVDMNQKFSKQTYDRTVYAQRPASTASASSVLSLSPDAPFQVEKGEFLSMSVTRDWSPTCALRTMFTEARLGHAPTYAVVGPEGYHLTDASTNSTSLGKSGSDTVNATAGNKTSLEVCLNKEFGTPGFVTALFGAKIRISLNACNNTYFDGSFTHSSVDSWQKSDGTQRSASFSSGIRIPGTPSPLHPAGALLAFVMPRGVTDLNRVMEIQVVNRETGILMSANADVYLVANDSRCTDSSGSLQVQAARYQTLEGVAKPAGEAMATALTSLRTKAARYEAQGVMLPAEGATLRSEAELAVGTALAKMPEVVRGLFSLWINNELSIIERLVEITRMNREQADMIAGIRSLRSAIDDAGTRNVLYAQLTHWRAQALSHEPTARRLHQVAQAYARRLLPVLRLRHPEDLKCIAGQVPAGATAALADMCRASGAELRGLARAKVSGKLEELVDSIQRATGHIDDIIENLDAAITPSTRTIAIRLPNPFVTYCVEGELPPEDGSCVIGRSDETSVRASTLTGNALSSRALWAALLGRPEAGGAAQGVGSFAMLPADLYSRAGVANSLPCNESAPIVTHAAIVIGNNGEEADTLNGRGHGAQVKPPTQAVFATTQGAESYKIWNPALGNTYNLPILSQHYRQVVNFFDGKVLQGSYGVSFATTPFTQYDLSVAQGVRTSFGRQLTEAYEAYLVLRVETLPFSNTSWVTSCKP